MEIEPIARPRKVLYTMRFAESAVAWRSGRVSLGTLNGSLVGRGGALLERVKDGWRWRAASFPDKALRQIRRGAEGHPCRINADATVLGNFAGYSSVYRGVMRPPILLARSAGDQLRQLAKITNAMCIFELFAVLCNIYKLRRQLIGRTLFTFVGMEQQKTTSRRLEFTAWGQSQLSRIVPARWGWPRGIWTEPIPHHGGSGRSSFAKWGGPNPKATINTDQLRPCVDF